MLIFDADALRQRLESVTRTGQAAFAAACAERLLPEFPAHMDRAPLREMLDSVWLFAAGTPVDRATAEAAFDQCKALIPDTIDDFTVRRLYAQQAAIAVASALGILVEDNPMQHAVGAAQMAAEAVESILEYEQDVNDFDEFLRHPLTQAELARQERDLVDASAGHIQRLRDRAGTESVRDN